MTTAAFEENLRVLQRSMAAPLRLTSLVVRQVLACMSAQFGQVTMAGVCRASALTLRVLETCPVHISTAAEAVPLTVRLARGSLDEASLPAALSQQRPATLKSPAAMFLTAAVLWHAGCMHYAHALVDRTSQPLLEQVHAVRAQQSPEVVEEVMRWLHMALTLQAACLLHSDTARPLREALQVRPISDSCLVQPLAAILRALTFCMDHPFHGSVWMHSPLNTDWLCCCSRWFHAQ